jgi:hypothetical protein
LRLALGGAREERTAAEGSAFNWNGYHVAVVAIYGPGELGAGLVALEVGTRASLPQRIDTSTVAGGADMRLRIPHRITHITLHHEGNAEALKPDDDVPKMLRALQSWGASDRNWWDVPYHFLLGYNGEIYEGHEHHLRSVRTFSDQRRRQLQQAGADSRSARIDRRSDGLGSEEVRRPPGQYSWPLQLR